MILRLAVPFYVHGEEFSYFINYHSIQTFAGAVRAWGGARVLLGRLCVDASGGVTRMEEGIGRGGRV